LLSKSQISQFFSFFQTLGPLRGSIHNNCLNLQPA